MNVDFMLGTAALTESTTYVYYHIYTARMHGIFYSNTWHLADAPGILPAWYYYSCVCFFTFRAYRYV